MLMSRFLRRVLIADAVATGAAGLLMFGLSGWLEPWLNVPASLLFFAGLALLPYTACVAYLSTRATVSRAAIWAVVLCNAAWAFDSVVLLATGWITPSTLGYAFVILQAAVVAVFCELQLMGMRRVSSAA